MAQDNYQRRSPPNIGKSGIDGTDLKGEFLQGVCRALRAGRRKLAHIELLEFRILRSFGGTRYRRQDKLSGPRAA
jgi:hypothetical protein